MLVGIHIEGNDWLIIRTLLAKLLEVEEQEIQIDRIDHSGLGWSAILDLAPKALKRFYGKCCALAVLGVDNDGNMNGQEDPRRPRHWLHTPSRHELCRQCDLELIVEKTRPALHWIPNKEGHTWPIVSCVPVEMIESWLLIALAVTNPGHGSLHAENEARADQKRAFYGRPEATREDVESTTLPLLRSLSTEQVRQVRLYSRSFDQFARQVLILKDQTALGNDCWS